LEKAGDERDAPDPNDCFLPITSVGFGSYAVVRLREFLRTFAMRSTARWCGPLQPASADCV